MKTLFLMVGALSLVAIAGCRGPKSGIPEGAKVAVLEFRIPETANITRYSASYNDLGMIVAQQLAGELRSRYRDGEAIPSGAPVHLVSPDRFFSASCGVLRDALWFAWKPFQARQRGVGVVGFGRPGRSLRVPDADSKEAAPWTAKTARATCGSRTAMCSRRICGCWSLGTGVSSRSPSPSSTQTAGWPPLVMLDASACPGGGQSNAS